MYYAILIKKISNLNDLCIQRLNFSIDLSKFNEFKTYSLISYRTMLAFGDKNDRYFKNAAKEYGEDKMLSPEEITAKYPAIENLPDTYTGYVTQDSGIIKSQVALEAYKLLCDNRGVELQFNTKIIEVSQNQVKTESGICYNADNVVVASGPFSQDLLDPKDENLVSIEQEYYQLDDNSGLPELFIEAGAHGAYNG